MTALTQDILILATEGGIPTSNPWSQLALPLGIVIFCGAVFLLLRSNLGTRRGYLVMSTSLWGFGFILSLFWAFGAPGTPPNTGPQNLPGQELDEYQPVWVPFADDSVVATGDDSPYAAVLDYPNGFGEVPESFADGAVTGVQNIGNFFSSINGLNEEYFNLLDGTEAVVDGPNYTVAENGRELIGVTYATTCQLVDPPEDAPEGTLAALPAYCEDAGLEIGDPVPADAVDESGNAIRQEQTFFAFFDAGAPFFPSLLMVGIMLVLLLIHLIPLGRDELREAKEAAEVEAEDVEVEEKTPVGV